MPFVKSLHPFYRKKYGKIPTHISAEYVQGLDAYKHLSLVQIRRHQQAAQRVQQLGFSSKTEGAYWEFGKEALGGRSSNRQGDHSPKEIMQNFISKYPLLAASPTKLSCDPRSLRIHERLVAGPLAQFLEKNYDS